MYKATARSYHFLRREGSYATHPSRRGTSTIVPFDPHDWYPQYFARWYPVAQQAVKDMAEEDMQFFEGADAAAAVAACHHLNEDDARRAMVNVLERMRLSES